MLAHLGVPTKRMLSSMSCFVFQKDYNFGIRELLWMRTFLFIRHLSFIDGNCQPLRMGIFIHPQKNFERMYVLGVEEES